MIDASPSPGPPTALAATALAPGPASALFLRDSEVRKGIELLYFGYGAMIRGADRILARQGLGRAHHRALYFIARQPGLAVSDLLRLLSITKQSLSRVLSDLVQHGLVESRTGEADRRRRLLTLTASGMALEAELLEALRERVAAAYAQAGQQAVTGFWAVLAGLVPVEDRALILALDRAAKDRERPGAPT